MKTTKANRRFARRLDALGYSNTSELARATDGAVSRTMICQMRGNVACSIETAVALSAATGGELRVTDCPLTERARRLATRLAKKKLTISF